MTSFSNPDELFDVVDEHDRAIFQAPRREVHARNLLHRAVHVLIHNEMGELFLQRRSMLKDTFPGCWDSSCSGHLDAGENYATAACRELGEELGWHDPTLPLRPVTKLSPSLATGWEFIQVFALGPCSGPFILNPEEITEGRWISPSDLRSELADSPDAFAGALRYLWAEHSRELAALFSSAESPRL